MVLSALMVMMACNRHVDDNRRSGQASPSDPVVVAVAPTVLAEASDEASALKVQILDAERVTADTLRIDIALVNTSKAEEPLDVARVLSGGRSGSFTAADLCLLTPDGSRRLFVLRDPADKPLTSGSFEPLKPGERRLVSAVFPSPGPATSRVTLVLADLVLRDVLVRGGRL
jgi:hypothetical protein